LDKVPEFKAGIGMNKNRISIFFAAVCLLFLSSVYAQHTGAGRSIFPYLGIDYDAHSGAMAGASVAVPNGAYGVLTNPAATAFVKGNQVYIGYRSIMDGVWGGPVAYSRNMGKYGVFTLSMIGVTSGDIDVVEEKNGNPVFTNETASENFITGGLSWAMPVGEELSLGLTIKGVYDRLRIPGSDYSATGMAFDGGAFYSLLRGRLTAGAVVRNAGFMISSSDGMNYNLPVVLEAGLSYVPRYIPSMRLALDINKELGDYMNFEPGMQFDLYKKTLSLMLGYAFSEKDLQQKFRSFSGNQDDDYVKSNWNALCLGLGINTDIDRIKLQLDFAFQFKSSSLPPSMLISVLLDY